MSQVRMGLVLTYCVDGHLGTTKDVKRTCVMQGAPLWTLELGTDHTQTPISKYKAKRQDGWI